MEPSQVNPQANISEAERLPSIVLGGCLAAFGLVRRTPGAVVLGAIGGMLLYRGVTSYCPVNAALGVSNAPSDHNPNATIAHKEGIKVDYSATIVGKSPADLYNYWKNFENLPTFMSHLVAVTNTGDKRSHWVAKAPLGRTVEWDAEVINDIPDSLIAWRSLEGADIANAGAVTFKPATGGRGTVVRVEIEYKLPAGKLGATIAKLLGGEEPGLQVDDDLRHFKQLMEAGELATADSHA